MRKILITGATGNVGLEVIRFLYNYRNTIQIIVGIRNIEEAKIIFKDYPDLEYVVFDFEKKETFEPAFFGVDRVFLLRPPHISDVGKYFDPLFTSMVENKIKDIVFLSVQGAEKSTIIPHNKIERLIVKYGFDYIFLRPGYFMQNLSTTLYQDIKTKREIILPAGKAKFNWIDIANIAEAAALLLDKFSEYKNQAYEITGLENENFAHVTSLINEVVTKPIRYRNVNPLQFYWIKKREGMASGFIIVMIVLHFLPKFQEEPRISSFFEQLTGRKPTDLRTFIERNKKLFEKG